MALNQFPRRAFSGAATIQTFTGNGSTTAFTLSQAQTQNECFVYVDDVAQVPVTDYGINGTTLTFTSAPANGSEIIVRGFGVPTPLNSVSDGSITSAKLANGAIETKLGYTPVSPTQLSTEVSNLVASAPSTLNTLNELATALGNDANFATTITNSLATKANQSTTYTKTETDNLLTPTNVSDKTNSSTGYLDLPSGTVAQRPVSPATGMMRFNTTGKWMEYYDGSSWIPLASGAYLYSWTNTNYGLAADGWKNMNSITCPDFGNNAKLISVSFDGYIVSGSYYWCWRIYNARSGTFLPTIGGWNSKDAYMSSGGGIGYRGNVHAMSTQPARTFDASDCLTGDTLRLELSASSGNGDTVYTNASQTLYVDNVNWWLGSLSGKEMDTWWNA